MRPELPPATFREVQPAPLVADLDLMTYVDRGKPPSHKAERVPLGRILAAIDKPETQIRIRMNPEWIRKYTGLMAELLIEDEAHGGAVDGKDAAERWHEQEREPVHLWVTPEGEFCADGYHRGRAAQAAGMKELLVVVFHGTFPEALEDSLRANKARGLPLTEEDTKNAVLKALETFRPPRLAEGDPAKWSQRKVSRITGASQSSVSRWEREWLAAKTGAAIEGGESGTQPELIAGSLPVQPAEVLGTDGKLHKPKKPKEPAPAAEVEWKTGTCFVVRKGVSQTPRALREKSGVIVAPTVKGIFHVRVFTHGGKRYQDAVFYTSQIEPHPDPMPREQALLELLKQGGLGKRKGAVEAALAEAQAVLAEETAPAASAAQAAPTAAPAAPTAPAAPRLLVALNWQTWHTLPYKKKVQLTDGPDPESPWSITWARQGAFWVTTAPPLVAEHLRKLVLHLHLVPVPAHWPDEPVELACNHPDGRGGRCYRPSRHGRKGGDPQGHLYRPMGKDELILVEPAQSAPIATVPTRTSAENAVVPEDDVLRRYWSLFEVGHGYARWTKQLHLIWVALSGSKKTVSIDRWGQIVLQGGEREVEIGTAMETLLRSVPRPSTSAPTADAAAEADVRVHGLLEKLWQIVGVRHGTTPLRFSEWLDNLFHIVRAVQREEERVNLHEWGGMREVTVPDAVRRLAGTLPYIPEKEPRKSERRQVALRVVRELGVSGPHVTAAVDGALRAADPNGSSLDLVIDVLTQLRETRRAT